MDRAGTSSTCASSRVSSAVCGLRGAVWQAVTLADTISGNDASGAGGAYVVTRRSDGSEVVRVDVTHDEIGTTRLHLEPSSPSRRRGVRRHVEPQRGAPRPIPTASRSSTSPTTRHGSAAAEVGRPRRRHPGLGCRDGLRGRPGGARGGPADAGRRDHRLPALRLGPGAGAVLRRLVGGHFGWAPDPRRFTRGRRDGRDAPHRRLQRSRGSGFPTPGYKPSSASPPSRVATRCASTCPPRRPGRVDLDRLNRLFADGAQTLILTQPHNPGAASSPVPSWRGSATSSYATARGSSATRSTRRWCFWARTTSPTARSTAPTTTRSRSWPLPRRSTPRPPDREVVVPSSAAAHPRRPADVRATTRTRRSAHRGAAAYELGDRGPPPSSSGSTRSPRCWAGSSPPTSPTCACVPSRRPTSPGSTPPPRRRRRRGGRAPARSRAGHRGVLRTGKPPATWRVTDRHLTGTRLTEVVERHAKAWT